VREMRDDGEDEREDRESERDPAGEVLVRSAENNHGDAEEDQREE